MELSSLQDQQSKYSWAGKEVPEDLKRKISDIQRQLSELRQEEQAGKSGKGACREILDKIRQTVETWKQAPVDEMNKEERLYDLRSAERSLDILSREGYCVPDELRHAISVFAAEIKRWNTPLPHGKRQEKDSDLAVRRIADIVRSWERSATDRSNWEMRKNELSAIERLRQALSWGRNTVAIADDIQRQIQAMNAEVAWWSTRGRSLSDRQQDVVKGIQERLDEWRKTATDDTNREQRRMDLEDMKIRVSRLEQEGVPLSPNMRKEIEAAAGIIEGMEASDVGLE